MKITKLTAVLLSTLVWVVPVCGQFSAQVGPAETVFSKQSKGFGYLGIYDDALGLIGGYRYGIGGYTDAAAKIGFIDFDKAGNDDSGFLLAGDLRYQIMEIRIKDPIDLTVGGLFETVLGIGASNFSLGGFVAGSRYIKLSENNEIWPYGRLIIRWDRVESNDKLNLGFNVGANYPLNESTSVSAEFQFDNQFGFIISLVFGI